MNKPRIENLEEIAVAVRNAEKAASLFYEIFGFKFELGWELPKEKTKVKSERIGGVQFQLLQSTTPDGVIAEFVESRGEGVHHIAFRVSNLEEMVARLKEKSVVFMPAKPVRAFGSSYIFIHPKSAHGVLIELIEY